MSEAEKVAAATSLATAKLKSLELLFDYTKFHIGLYLTVTAGYLAVATVKTGEVPIVQFKSPFCPDIRTTPAVDLRHAFCGATPLVFADDCVRLGAPPSARCH